MSPLSLDTPPPTEASVGNNIAATSEETMQTGNDVCEPSKSRGDSADERSKTVRGRVTVMSQIKGCDK